MNTEKDKQHDKIKLAVADDHIMFREGLVELITLGEDSPYEVVLAVDDGEQLIDKFNKRDLPDILIVDIGMRNKDGYEVVDWIKKYHPEVKILVITMFETDDSVLRMVQLGVQGFLTKNMEPVEIHRALEALISGGVYFPSAVTEVMARYIKDGGGTQLGSISELTERDRTFIKLACTKLTYSQIADRMNISAKGVEKYAAVIYKKLNVGSRHMLVAYAYINKLMES